MTRSTTSNYIISFGVSNLLLLVVLLFPVDGNATTFCNATVSWVPSAPTDTVGYNIYYGTNVGGPYPSKVDNGNPGISDDGRIYGVVTGLYCNLTYYLVYAAYDSQGNESGYSNEVVFSAQLPEIKSMQIKTGTNP